MANSSASREWTDHNIHEPGLTLLQVLVYTLGAVSLVVVSAAAVRSRRRRRDFG